MSKDKITEDTGSETSPGAETTFGKTEEPPPEPAATQRSQKSLGIVASLALILSVIAVSGLGLNYLRDKYMQGASLDQAAELLSLAATVARAEKTISSVEQSLLTLTALDVERNTAIGQIEQQLSGRLRQLESLPNRLSAVESSISSFQGISTGARDDWLIAEAEYYMQLANAQLQLANNPELAILALNHADDRLIQLSDARLTQTRGALSDELRALETMEKPDISGIVLTLTSLAGVIESLPLADTLIMSEQPQPNGPGSELTGINRAWTSVTNALKGIIKIRDTTGVVLPLIAPREEYFLRANVSLQLQAARLALLRGEEAVFSQSLDDTDVWLAEYYDKDNTGVISARKTIADIQGNVITVPIPDISRSIFLLRQYNELYKTGAAEADQNQ